MKILFIDPVSLPDHANFNRIHIDALHSQFGRDVDCCLVEGYSDYLHIDDIKASIIYEIPKKKIITDKGGIRYRISIFRAFRSIRKHVKLAHYDVIIISCYDEIALFFSNFPKSYIINHNNISNLNPIKKWFFKKIAKRHTHIVLTQDSTKYVSSLGLKCITLPHGLPKPLDKKRTLKDPLFNVVALSQNSSDADFIQALINDENVLKWIREHKVKLVLRGNLQSDGGPNIRIINGRLTSEEYDELLINSDCLMICYPPTFRYRASGVLLEGISNGKLCILRDLPNFTEYKSIFGQGAFFSDAQTFVSAIDYVMHHGYAPNINRNNLDIFNPNYDFLNTYTH